jgi:membrane-bound lytic murein transglycosylase F
MKSHPVGVLVLLCLCNSLFTCKESPPPEESARPGEAARENPTTVKAADLADLRKRGSLRILLPQREEASRLPRRGFPPDLERELAERFARSLKLEPVLVHVDAYEDLIPGLLSGKGDILVAGLTVTPERKERVAFTAPVAVAREQVITRADDEKLSRPEQLAGRRIALRRSSSYWSTVQELRKTHPGASVQEVDENLDTEEILYRVSTGEYDVTVADSNLVRAVSAYLPDLKVACDLGGLQPWAWAVRPQATRLRRALDQFLSEVQLETPESKAYADDLPKIVRRGVLRVLTRNSAATYFLHRGELLGFEYELAREFARRHDLSVKLVVPPSREDLIPWLLEGKGDLVAAALTVTEERKRKGVVFSRPYHFVSEVVVARADEKGLDKPDALAGRTLVVRKSSSYWQTLNRLRDSGVALKLQAAPEDMETEEIIAAVAEGRYDLTVADSHIADIELTYRNDVQAACTLGEEVPHAWALRPGNPKLRAAVDAFFKKEYRGVFYNLTHRKYFKNPRSIQAHVTQRAARSGKISAYDALIRNHAERYGFDWRLIAAQAFAESRFDPKARSWVGAQGLMQVMPRTARELGFEDVTRPEPGIHAGVKYMARLRDRFDAELPVHDRNWFTLAAYNAGYGHVLDARRLARKKRWDPDRWFANVERAMLLLSHPAYARRARYGYCRGSEPVAYVRKIKKTYDAYLRVASP